jgi:predicted Na+-dependent transporter
MRMTMDFLANRTAQRVARITGAIAVPMIGVGLLISDSGHHPAPIWEVLGIVGLAVLVPSLPFQIYYWYAKVTSSPRRRQTGD